MTPWAPVKVGSIVEGDGEVAAVAELLHRLGAELDPPVLLAAKSPVRVHRDRFLIGAGVSKPSKSAKASLAADRQREFGDRVDIAARRATDMGFMLVLLDTEGGCAAQLGPALAKAVYAERSDRTSVVAFAHQEYECWFLAAAESIRGKCSLADDLTAHPAPETKRDAKGWLTDHMPDGVCYKETTNQEKLAAVFDMAAAYAACRSFRHLCTAIAEACRDLGWAGSAPWEDGRWP